MKKKIQASGLCVMGKWPDESGHGTVDDYNMVMRRSGAVCAPFRIEAVVELTAQEWHDITNDLMSPRDVFRGRGSAADTMPDNRRGIMLCNEETGEAILVDPQGTDTAYQVGFIMPATVPEHLAGEMIPMMFQ